MQEGRTGLLFCFFENGINAVPVSYTHLDVYKRQGQGLRRIDGCFACAQCPKDRAVFLGQLFIKAEERFPDHGLGPARQYAVGHPAAPDAVFYDAVLIDDDDSVTAGVIVLHHLVELF